MYVGFKTLFYVVRHIDSTASYLPTGLHLGFFRSWPSLYLTSSFSSVFLVLTSVSASTSMLFWVIFLLPFFGTWPYHASWFSSISFKIGSSNPIYCLMVTEKQLTGGKKLSCSFYLYRFLKYVSYGFSTINFSNPGVHYETPCIKLKVDDTILYL